MFHQMMWGGIRASEIARKIIMTRIDVLHATLSLILYLKVREVVRQHTLPHD